MEKLKVLINKAGEGVSANIPELDGFVISRPSIAALKKDIRESVCFHIEGLYPEEHAPWMEGDFDFEFVFCDIPSLISGYGDTMNQSHLARIAGMNESQMRQYVSGIKKPSKKVLQRIEEGLHRYADEIQNIHFKIA
jgi:hypothetical protein